MGQGRPALQAGVEEGLPHLSRELQSRVRQLLEVDDWSSLDVETQSLGLALGQREEAWAWLAEQFSVNPGRVVDLALTTWRWSFRFARVGGRVVRVPIRVDTPRSPQFPPPEFWRAVRAAIEAQPRLRHDFELARARHTVTDLRYRAGVAHVLWDDPAAWTREDAIATNHVVDPDSGQTLLLALLRASSAAVRSEYWPPPISALNTLPDVAFFAACRWYPKEEADDATRARLACRATLGRASSVSGAPVVRAQWGLGPGELLRRLGDFADFLLLAAAVPHPAHLARARELSPPAGTQEALLHEYLVDRWRRVIEGDGVADQRLAAAVAPGERPLSRTELVALRRALTTGAVSDPGALGPRIPAEALERFAAHRFLDALVEDRLLRSRGAVASMRVARSAPWVSLVRRLLSWAEGRADVRLIRGCLAVLRQQRSPLAFDGLVAFRERTKDSYLQAVAQGAMGEVASELGLSVEEARERLFPEVSPPPPRCRPVLAVGPEVVFESVDEQLLLERAIPGQAPARKQAALPTDWARASVALRSFRPRLEALMLDAPPMSAVHFTETWGMHPVLRLVAEKLAWGAWEGPRRVALFIPGRLDAARLEEHHVVRPVHPAELTGEELEQLRAALPGAQPIEQLRRPVHLRVWRGGDAVELTVDEGGVRPCLPPWRRVSEWSFACSGRGWYAGVAFTRREPGWRKARLFVNPSDGATSVPPGIKSEVARQVARWLASADLVADGR